MSMKRIQQNHLHYSIDQISPPQVFHYYFFEVSVKKSCWWKIPLTHFGEKRSGMHAILKLCQESSTLKALTTFLEIPVIRLCRIHVHTDLQKQHPLLLILDWVWKLLDTGFLLSKIPVQECSPIKEWTCTFSTHSSPSKIARHKFASNNSNGQAVLVNPQSNPESDFHHIVE